MTGSRIAAAAQTAQVRLRTPRQPDRRFDLSSPRRPDVTRRLFVFAFLLLVPARPTSARPAVVPPIAPRRPHDVVAAAGTRSDPYYWLRDDTRSKPEVLEYLKAENAYYAAASAPYRALTAKLNGELVGRLKQDERSVPYKDKDYLYYTYYVAGKENPVYARHAVAGGPEQILVDADREANGKAFYQVDGREVSPRQDRLAFLEDTVGRRQFTLRFRDIASGKDLAERISGLSASVAWAGDNQTVYYVENDPVTLLSTRVKKHVLGTDVKADPLVYEEKDTSFYLRVDKSSDDRFVIIDLGSTVANECRVIAADDPSSRMQLLAPRERDLLYSADHIAGRWVVRTNLRAPNYRLMDVRDAEIGDKAAWKDVLPYDPAVFIEDFTLFRDYLAINERNNGLLRIRVVAWAAPEKAFPVESDEPAYAEGFSVNAEQDTPQLRYTHTSLTTPASVYEVDMRTGARPLLKRESVLGGFDPANYVTERVWATARDGAKVPVSLAYRKGLARDGRAPLYQYAYGAYGASSDPIFDSTVVSLLDRGFVYALAHIRGGQEMGRAWYDHGKLLEKRNTFTDFVDVTDFLVKEKYAASDKVCAMGLSAGGLLMGSVANLAGEKYRAIVAHVPFVDAVTTMLDDTIPLTSNEWEEWGDPRKKEYYDYILSYSPYDNVAAKAYPALLVTTSLDDSQVQYYEPAKWVAKLRATKTDRNPLLFKIEMAGGHGGKSGRFASLTETAEEYAFLLNLLGITH
jgi:oligopeptidase B